MIASPMYLENVFRKFSTAQIGKLLQEEYPNFSLGSILPNDHAKGNAASCWCVGTPQQIFNKVRRGFYRVRQYQHLFRIEAVPGGVESLAFDISTRQLTRMPARGRFAVPVTLQ